MVLSCPLPYLTAVRNRNIAEMSQTTPETAVHYSFYSPSGSLGPMAALEELQNMGCTLATEGWVYNHWGLILWKQAGMLCLDPSEALRWSWEETVAQLRYRCASLRRYYCYPPNSAAHRYERELQGGSRPPFKLIAAGDSPPSSPMVLCVSKVIWMGGQRNSDGAAEDVPELEITDGWYRLRAEVDAPLVRAIRRGVIKPGRKIGVVDAKARNFVICTLRCIDEGSVGFRSQGALGNPRGLRQR